MRGRRGRRSAPRPGTLDAFVGSVGPVIVGVVPIVAGTFNVCLFAPLVGLDFTGHKRAAS
jgi:hypothetical protein